MSRFISALFPLFISNKNLLLYNLLFPIVLTEFLQLLYNLMTNYLLEWIELYISPSTFSL